MSLIAEQAVIGGMMTDPNICEEAMEGLTTLDFTDDAMRLIFELICKLKDAGRATDVVTMSAAMSKSIRWNNLSTDDPANLLFALQDSSYGLVSTRDYIRIIRAESVGRDLLNYATEIHALTKEQDLSGDEMLARAAQMLPTAETTQGVVTYRDAAMSALETIKRMKNGELLGVPTGLPNLDKLIMGFEPGTLIVLGGRPSHGKSLYGMDFAHAATQRGSVQVYSLEMTAANLAMRGISSIGGVDFGDLRQGKIEGHTEGLTAFALSEIKKMNLYIDDRSGLTVDQLRSRARMLARKDPPALIVCDYLQLLAGQGNNRNEQIGYVSRSLKAMAKELNVPVLCLAQVNRGVESRPDKRPMSSDLRDSGEIEQDADVIMFTYLSEKYYEDSGRKGIGELIVRKQRNGPTGSIFTEFQGRFQRFKEFTGIVPAEHAEPESSGMASYVKRHEEFK